jgi:hypothetical protein
MKGRGRKKGMKERLRRLPTDLIIIAKEKFKRQRHQLSLYIMAGYTLKKSSVSFFFYFLKFVFLPLFLFFVCFGSTGVRIPFVFIYGSMSSFISRRFECVDNSFTPAFLFRVWYQYPLPETTIVYIIASLIKMMNLSLLHFLSFHLLCFPPFSLPFKYYEIIRDLFARFRLATHN